MNKSKLIKTMKYLLLIFSLLIFVGAFSQKKNDSTTIIQLLKDDYKTMVNWDIEQHKKYCTDDYVLIENGEIWNMEREAANFKKYAAIIRDRKDYFDFRLVRIEGKSAYAVYVLKSDFTVNGKPTTMQWSESAIFRKVQNVWKIALIHSTVLPAK